MICFASLLPPVCSPLYCPSSVPFSHVSGSLFLGLPTARSATCLAQKENTFHGGEAELEVGCFSLSISFL